MNLFAFSLHIMEKERARVWLFEKKPGTRDTHLAKTETYLTKHKLRKGDCNVFYLRSSSRSFIFRFGLCDIKYIIG